MDGKHSIITGACLVVSLLATEGLGQSTAFRVETDVFASGQLKPVQQTLTLFKGGVAYDFSRDEPHRIVMIDPVRGRIRLIDSSEEVQTEIDLPQLVALMNSARKELATSEMAVYIQDAEKVKQDGNRITVGEKVLRYEATLQTPKEADIAKQYAEFADASAMLNAWQARNPPPFARLSLNASLADAESLPEEISRTALLGLSEKRAEESKVKCRLHCNWR
jgi:hypothetical protein